MTNQDDVKRLLDAIESAEAENKKFRELMAKEVSDAISSVKEAADNLSAAMSPLDVEKRAAVLQSKTALTNAVIISSAIRVAVADLLAASQATKGFP